MATSNQTSARPFKCPSCAKAFTRHENLKRHVNTHHSGFNARSFQCTLCNARFARSDLRKRHVENCHVQSFTTPKAVVSEPQLPLPSIAQSPTSAWLEILMADPTPFPPPPAPPVSKVSAPFQAQVLKQSASNESPCITAFFSHFHRNFPILHEASFHVISAPTPLLNAITCIGSMYCTSEYTEQSRNNLFESTLASVQSYVEQNRSRYQETWVLQTFLLLEYIGIYGGNDTSFLKAQRIHRDLVDAIRMLQMSHDGGASSSSSFQDSSDVEESEREEDDEQFEGMESLDSRWQEFVKNESKKRCIYTLYLLDSQLSILCNLRPMLSSLEIKYGLPSCEDIWLAKTSTQWSTLQKQQFRSFDDHDDQSYTQETPPSQGFFYEASQSLLHSNHSNYGHGQQQHQQQEGNGNGSGYGNGNGNESKYPRQPRKLRLLWASPFAAVILVIQLQMMARELTHASCLLERPKSQRRTLSVLTDKQHAQISQALKGIAELVPRNQSFAANTFSFSSSSFSSSSSPPSFMNFFDTGNNSNNSRNGGGGGGGGGAFGYGNHNGHDTGRFSENDEIEEEITPLWHTFWILWYYTSITLSHPDSLLVSGIVEVNLPLAIATAGHLATPRSKDKRDFYEDRDVFRILSPLESALSLLSPQPTPQPIPQPQTQPQQPPSTTTTIQSSPHIHETPFTTLLGFKICLVGWRLVRLTMGEAAEAELQAQQAAAAVGNSRLKRKSTSNPCKFVLDAIMACVYDDNYDDGDEHGGGGGGIRPGREIMRSEVCFLEWIVESFKKRSSWPVGKWVTAVMEERLATAAEAYAATSKTP